MDIDFNIPTIITKRNVDSGGNPISVKLIEIRQIMDNYSCVVLSQTPDEYNRIYIEGFTEVFDIEKLDKKNFKVDYSQGIIYFHPFNIGKAIAIEYYGVGYELISASRVFISTDKHGNVIDTLEEILNRASLQLKLIESLGGAIKVIEKLDEDIKNANNLNAYFDEMIPEATGLKNELDTIVTDAKGWKDQLKQDVADGKILQPLLHNDVIQGREVKQQLDQSIADAENTITKIEATGNEIVNIISSEWVYNDTSKMYEKQITHTCNSENIHVTCKTSDTKEALFLPWKIVDKSNVLLKSDEAIGVNVIISARYYKALIDNTTTQEVIDARKGEATLLDKMNKVDTSLDNVANDLPELLNQIEKNKKHIVIKKNINITDNVIIPKDIVLEFKDEGCFTIGDGKLLTIKGVIKADYKKIFIFNGDNSEVLSTKNSIQYKVKADWFGADPNCTIPDDNEYLEDGVCNGVDSTMAFKRCIKFVESGCNTFNSLSARRNQSSVIIEFKPNGNYYCIGDNPLGVQSEEVNIGYFINVEGNKCCINWKPTGKTQALFKKYGRIVAPSIKNLNVNLIGKKGQRWGRFLDSKTYEGDNYHYWTQGIFKNLFLNVQYLQVGYDIVFNLEGDTINSHDDTSLMENVYGGSYNTFIKFANTESVNWKLDKCMFHSQTANAVHIDIQPNHSSGINIVNSDILLANDNEIFLKINDNTSIAPLNIIGCRIENRNTSNIKLLHLESGRVNVEGLNILGGNDGIPNETLRLCYIGEKAQANFKDCELFDKMNVVLNKTANYIYDNALTFDNCSFIGVVAQDEANTLGYPTIKYICEGIERNIEYVIKNGYKLRSIDVNNPRYVNTWLTIPIRYGNSYASNFSKIRINNVDSKGYTKLNISGSLPPNLAITNLDISYSGADTNNVTSVFIKFINRKYNKEFTVEHAITTAPQYNKVLIGGVLTMPFDNFNEIVVFYQKNGVLVTDTNLHPNGYIEMEIKGINNRSELPSVDGEIQNKDKLTFN